MSALPNQSDLTGRTIKGYEFRSKLGAGGFGAVYSAYQAIVEREVAIKVILPAYANQPDFIRRFENEAQLIARLEHLHIVPLHDYWREPDGAYLVMRWLQGGSLRSKLSKEVLSLETIAGIVDQVASALTAAHRRKIVHRDNRSPRSKA
jgi:serine/threonine protein kinase